MAEKKDIKLYEGSEDWSALYVDGKLEVIGDHYWVQEKLIQILSVEVYSSDDFLRGGNSRKEAAQTLEELEAFQALRAQAERDADALEFQARQLEDQAKALRESAKQTS